MEIRFENGKYAASRFGGFETVSGDEETIQRVRMRLEARRGGFFPLPGYGSRLYALCGMKKEQRAQAARRFVREALEDEKGVAVKDVRYAETADGATVTVALELASGSAGIALAV